MFYISESVALIISNIAIIFTSLNPWRGIWNCRTAKPRGRMDGIRWSVLQKIKNSISIDFLHFFAKRRKSVQKMTHPKKNSGHRTSKIVKFTQSYSNGHLPYCSLYCLARALDAWRGMWISCAVRMRRNNGITTTNRCLALHCSQCLFCSNLCGNERKNWVNLVGEQEVKKLRVTGKLAVFQWAGATLGL